MTAEWALSACDAYRRVAPVHGRFLATIWPWAREGATGGTERVTRR